MIFRAKGKNRHLAALKVVIAGGVTGGHLFPGIAIAQAFMKKDPENEILFISSGNSLERSALSRAGFALNVISVGGIKGRGLKNQAGAIFDLPKGIWEAASHLNRFRPDLVIGMGCYSAGPVAVGAWLMGIRMVLHEQNILPGVTNRILSHFADRIYLSFDNGLTGLDQKKIRYSGNPVRMEFIKRDDLVADHPKTGEEKKKPFTVLIIGGSQGAHSINMAMMEALAFIKPKEEYFFVHQTGTTDESHVRDAYAQQGFEAVVEPFFHDMNQRYQEADLVICRSGATTAAEITVLGKAAIFIPFPHAADNHQTLNALALTKDGAAEMIPEKDLDGKVLAEHLAYYAANPEVLLKMEQAARKRGRPDAAEFIVNDCYSFLKD